MPLATGGLMRGNDIELREDVLVAGFPYGDIFSNTIKVTKGIVNSTKGVGDDTGQFRLDAAVQPGNSGGPIYDKYGNIVGVVVAQLNKLKMAKTIGSLPENVNFGIKASTVKQFLNSSGLPRLLQDFAIKRDQLFADIQKANPKSVTVILDTCYSGTTCGTDMLIASRPIAIRALEQSIPNNFTVLGAATDDQTSKPLEEAKHGMFSYFLMKGMEGDADTNADNKITAQELHNYVKENVTQQSSGSQTPELQGDKDRVLVQFN